VVESCIRARGWRERQLVTVTGASDRGRQRLHDGWLRGALRACRASRWRSLRFEIQTEGYIDLRGFLGLEDTIPAGYKSLNYTVKIKGNAGRRTVRQNPAR
jgi:hypothetical protein